MASLCELSVCIVRYLTNDSPQSKPYRHVCQHGQGDPQIQCLGLQRKPLHNLLIQAVLSKSVADMATTLCVKTLTVCSNKLTYLSESTSSQQLVATFMLRIP
jgi:hypothetical protein